MAASKVELVDGRYVVRGELVNAGASAGSTTTLKLVFRKGDDVLGERSLSPDRGPDRAGCSDWLQPAVRGPARRHDQRRAERPVS